MTSLYKEFVWSWLQLLVESLQNNNNINWIWKFLLYFLFINKAIRLNNLKTRAAMNARISLFVVCCKVIIYLLKYNLHDCTFKVIFSCDFKFVFLKKNPLSHFSFPILGPAFFYWNRFVYKSGIGEKMNFDNYLHASKCSKIIWWKKILVVNFYVCTVVV